MKPNEWNQGRVDAMWNALRQLEDVIAAHPADRAQELEWLAEEWAAFLDAQAERVGGHAKMVMATGERVCTGEKGFCRHCAAL